MEITNIWPFTEVLSVTPISNKNQQHSPMTTVPPTVTTGGNELFAVTFKKSNKKTETLKFSSEYRSDILCEMLQHRHKFAEPNFPVTTGLQNVQYSCFKHHWSDRKLSLTIEIGQASVNQVDSLNGKIICSYLYKDIETVAKVSDLPGGFVISYGGFGRLHMFSCSPNDNSFRDELLKKICETAWQTSGVILHVKKDPIPQEFFQSNRFGRYSTDEAITSLCEFTVYKTTSRSSQSDSIRRLLAITDTCLVERDPNTYMIVTLRPLSEIFALIRSETNPQSFSIEYVRGQVRTYTSTDRDALLASLLDGVRASGNVDVHVKMTPSQRGYRLDPFYVPIDEEVESNFLKFLQCSPPGWKFNETIARFNANCAYSGLLHSVTQDGLFAENKEKLIHGALNSFIERDSLNQNDASNEDLEQHFQAIRRLVASKAGFAAFTFSSRFRETLGKKVVSSLNRGCDAVTHAAIDMLCVLMQVSILISSDYT